MGITGVSATSSVGSLNINEAHILTSPGASTASVGAIAPDGQTVGLVGQGLLLSQFGSISPRTDVSLTLTGLSTTSAVGSITAGLIEIIPLTGVSTTSSVCSIGIGLTVFPTGVSATSSVGSIVVELGIPLTGVSTTSAVGSISPNIAEVINLTGVQATTELNPNVGLQYLNRLTPKDGTGYSRLAPKDGAGYTRIVAN